jgi:hypothetical protein
MFTVHPSAAKPEDFCSRRGSGDFQCHATTIFILFLQLNFMHVHRQRHRYVTTFSTNFAQVIANVVWFG